VTKRIRGTCWCHSLQISLLSQLRDCREASLEADQRADYFAGRLLSGHTLRTWSDVGAESALGGKAEVGLRGR
jgi:hypothetical protein